MLALVLAACGHSQPPEPEIRPVRTATVLSGAARESNTYTAEIRPRYETDLSFQVGGKIIARPLDAGAQVKRGALLARLDEHDQRMQSDCPVGAGGSGGRVRAGAHG
jgi:multidrug efflux pump subunit AcrA (membrane-fusion protein)